MNKRLLAVFAHPDDEAFGPGGTLATYAQRGVEIHILTATRGEAGQWHEESKIKNLKSKENQDLKIHHVREQELLKSAKVLGVSKVEFLDFEDGTLCNNIYHKLAAKIIKKINSFKPQIVLTIDRLGVSGHLDHIAISMITTFAFRKTTVSNKLYYHVLAKKLRTKDLDDYFVYFPEGYDEDQITTRVNYQENWDKKVTAMKQHISQTADVNRILKRYSKFPKIDHFILQYHRGISTSLPETDLFDGIA